MTQSEWNYLRDYYLDHPNAPLHPDIRSGLDTYLVDKYLRQTNLRLICELIDTISELELLEEYLSTKYKSLRSDEEIKRMDDLIEAAKDYVKRKECATS